MNEMLNNPFGLTETEIYVFGLGREHEQERIIKLLENRPNFCSSDDESCFEWLETGDCDCKELIALIKGEK